MIGQIMASWVISPVLGGGIAAFLLWSIDTNIMHKENRHEAAQNWVPVYVGVMAGAFTSYLIMKGLNKIISIDEMYAVLGGVLMFIGVYF
jgi:PiT family inorganic phosphate transporter